MFFCIRRFQPVSPMDLGFVSVMRDKGSCDESLDLPEVKAQ